MVSDFLSCMGIGTISSVALREGNEMNAFIIREAQTDDAERLVQIYSYYVLNTAVSFEYKVPSVDEFKRRIEKTKEKYPYLVCVESDTIVGYAYAGAYSLREAYSWTVATSIYVDKEQRRRGIGTLLYMELEHRLKAMGIVNLLAGAAYCDIEDEYLSHDSYNFHKRAGFSEVAHMKSIGRKFDKWYDLVWLQKKL